MAIPLHRWRFIVRLLALIINILDHRLQDPGILKFQVLFVQLQCCPRVLDTVVCLKLDVFFQNTPGQESEREFAKALFYIEEIDCVNDLRLGDVDVRHSEILLETVTEELAAQI